MASATAAVALAAAAAISIAAALFSASLYSRKSKKLSSQVQDLEASLAAALQKCAAERRGRVRSQQKLRNALVQQSSYESNNFSASSAYPMVPIGTVHSCFSTRNGTPRQPLLVPKARACVVFDQTRVPAEALEGLIDYSHCWILYVFHLNTDLEKLWKEPARSKFKAKVRVPRLKGEKMGVLATRSPHRPCPIGLTVAKVEALHKNALLLSGVDLVDGTPVLDIKPYLPYSDCLAGASIPDWLQDDTALSMASVNFSEDFVSSLSSCWDSAGKHSLYSSLDEFQTLIKEVLSWDIRSLSQRNRPHHVLADPSALMKSCHGKSDDEVSSEASSDGPVVYHLILEGIDLSYTINNSSCNILVEKATLVDTKRSMNNSNNLNWRDVIFFEKQLERCN